MKIISRLSGVYIACAEESPQFRSYGRTCLSSTFLRLVWG